MKITIGNVVIVDNAANNEDRAPAADVIKFDSAGAQPPGFALPANSSVSRIRGTVKIGVVGTVVQFLPPGAMSLVLTNLHAAAQQGAGNGSLTISFEQDFAGMPGPIDAGHAIEADFSDLNGATVSGSSLTWSAFVDAQQLPSPPNQPFTHLNQANAPANVHVQPNAQNWIMRNIAGGPAWTLKGELIILLNGTGQTLRLPNSAEVGIAPARRDTQQQKR